MKQECQSYHDNNKNIGTGTSNFQKKTTKTKIKSDLSLYSKYYAEACDELAGPILNLIIKLILSRFDGFSTFGKAKAKLDGSLPADPVNEQRIANDRRCDAQKYFLSTVKSAIIQKYLIMEPSEN